jgi:hypothetical protein
MFRTNQGAGVSGLPGEIKVGGWFDTVPDQKAAASQPWNYGFYFVADQALYRVPRPVSTPAVDGNGKQTPAVPSTEKGLSMFTHIGFAPRNSSLMNFYIDGGLNYKGLFPTRDNDVLGVAFAYAHLTNNPQENDPGLISWLRNGIGGNISNGDHPMAHCPTRCPIGDPPVRGRYRERPGFGGPSDRFLLKGTPAIR